MTAPPSACGQHQATCVSGQCIDREAVCDGVVDCLDKSDESSCRKYLSLGGKVA